MKKFFLIGMAALALTLGAELMAPHHASAGWWGGSSAGGKGGGSAKRARNRAATGNNGATSGSSTASAVRGLEWDTGAYSSFGTAADKKLPIVIQFADSDISDETTAYTEVGAAAKMAGSAAVFVIVQKGEVIKALDDDGEAKKEVKTVVPSNKLEADCLFTAFGAKEGAFVVTDWHGNAIKSFSKKPSFSSIKSAVAKAKKDAEKAEKAMVKDAEAANAAFDKGDHAKALKHALKVFKHGKAGFDSVESTKVVYEAIVEEGRMTLETAKEEGDAKTLATLKKTFKGTDLEGEVKAAEKALKAKK